MLTLPNLSLNKQKQIRKLKQKKFRRITQSFICEGFRLFETAINTPGLQINELLLEQNILDTPQGKLSMTQAQKRKIPVYSVEENTMREISEDMSSPGILFTVEKQTKDKNFLKDVDDRLLLYLDRVSEPGNIGTIMRSAVWFGLDKILLSPGCVDPFNSKSIRASAGAIFGIEIILDIDFEWIKNHLRKKKYHFTATVISNGIPLDRWKMKSKNIIFFGQEADGLSKEILDNADTHLQIPPLGNIDSLNLSVATGIVLYELSKSNSTENE
jgi:TrmH family RNA methyltransferase